MATSSSICSISPLSILASISWLISFIFLEALFCFGFAAALASFFNSSDAFLRSSSMLFSFGAVSGNSTGAFNSLFSFFNSFNSSLILSNSLLISSCFSAEFSFSFSDNLSCFSASFSNLSAICSAFFST